MAELDAQPVVDPAKARWTPYQWYAITLLLLVNVVAALDRFVLGSLQEHLKADLQLSDAQLGIIAGPAFSLCYVLSAIPIARLAERFNRGRLLAGVLSFWSCATALCGFATGFASLILCRMAVGLGEGGSHPISQSTIGDTFGARQRGSAMSIYAAGSPIASIIAPVIVGAIAAAFGWRIAFFVVGVPGIILAIVLWFTLREPRHAMPQAERRVGSLFADLAWASRNRAFVCIFIAGAFNGIAITGIMAFTTSFVMRTQGFDIASAGLVVGALGGMGLIGTFVGGYVADRYADANGRSYVNVCSAGAVMSLIFFLIAFTQQGWTLVLVSLLLANLATGIKNGPNFAAVQNVVPSHMRATAAAVFTIASNVIGIGLGALVVGLLSDTAAAMLFDPRLGEFATICKLAHAPGSVSAAIASACQTTSAEGLRIALAIVTLFFIGSATFYYLAGRRISINVD